MRNYLCSIFCLFVMSVGSCVDKSDDAIADGDRLRTADRQRALPANLEIIESQINGMFEGFEPNRIFKLVNGQVWEQIEPFYWYHYAAMPRVTIICTSGSGRMTVSGVDHAVTVRLLSRVPETAGIRAATDVPLPDMIESTIDGVFKGYRMGQIYKLANGQIWEQTSIDVSAAALVRPSVVIVNSDGVFRMTVNEQSGFVQVRLLASNQTVCNTSPDVSASPDKGPYPNGAVGESPIEILKEAIRSGDGKIIAADGVFLGKLAGQFDPDSIVNQYGLYGSEFSAKSIYNQFSNYGSEFSTLSPYNQFSQTPPRVYSGGKAVLYLTTNETLTPRVHPDALKALVLE